MNAARRPWPVVAIDGPAGVGKSTTARLLAQRLGFTYVDTGALYRAVAWAARQAAVSWDDEPGLVRLMADLDLRLDTQASGATRLWIDGQDRSADIREPDISLGASAVSRHPGVRQALLERQRSLGGQGSSVLEGRDIGTVVFPDAEVKVFLTAPAEVRARRRHAELVPAPGDPVSYQHTLAAVQQRDAQDQNRTVAPLKPADDAVVLETSTLSVEEVVSWVLELVRRKTNKDSL